MQLWAGALRDRRATRGGRWHPDGDLALALLLQRAQRLGLFSKKIDPTAIARTIIAMFQGFILQRVLGEPFKASAALASFDVFLRGLAAEG